MNRFLSPLLALQLALCGITFSAAHAQTSATRDADSKKEEPKDTKDKLVQQAEDKFREGKVDECYKLLEEAVKKNPALPPARLMIARLYFGSNNASAGRNQLEAAIAESPDHPDVYLANASIALSEGRITDTLMNCQFALQQAEYGDRWTAAQRRKFQSEARAGLATAYELRRDWNAARTQLSAWTLLDEKNAGIKQRLARAHFMLGKETEAETELKAAAAAASDPKFGPPELIMAELYASQIGANQSEDEATQKKFDAKDKEYTEKASEYFDKAVKKFPDNPRVQQAYAGWLLNTGKLQAARVYIENAKKLDAESRDSLALVGLEARLNDNLSAAEKAFQQILIDQPSDFFAANQLALVLVESAEERKRTRALQLAEGNVSRDQRSAEAHATLAWVLFRLGRYEEAEKRLSVALSSGQATPDTVYYLAKVLENKKEYKKAYDVLEKALKSKSSFYSRRKASELLPTLKAKIPADESKDKKDAAKKE